MSDQTANDRTEWTVMGYLAGDNNLNEEMVLTLQELVASRKQFGRALWPRVKIFAQLDPSGLGLPTQRYVFDTTRSTVNPSNEHRLDTYEVAPVLNSEHYRTDVNTGHPAALSGFVKWVVDGEPHTAMADHYMLILSGHGSGSTEDFLLRDDAPVDSLTVPELEESLVRARKFLFNGANGQKIDLLGLDCCFMSMVEVFYQIREHVDIVVAAESMIPDFGWPYHRILAAATDERNRTDTAVKPERLAEIVVEQFIEYYSDYDRTAGRSVDLAWVKLDQMQALKDSISGLGGALKNALEDGSCRDQIILAHWEAQTYKFDQFVDIKDFCEITKERFGELEDNSLAPAVVDACANVLAKHELSLGRSGCSGFAYQHSYGLSMYFPWASVFESYKYERPPEGRKGFEWARDNEWVEFLNEYVVKTRRTLRPDLRDSTDVDKRQRMAIDLAVDVLARSANAGDMKRAEKIIRALLRMMARAVGAGESNELHPGSRYHKSRYHKSRYHKSRYHKSRWPGDREKSVKNLTPAVGTAFWPKPTESH